MPGAGEANKQMAAEATICLLRQRVVFTPRPSSP